MSTVLLVIGIVLLVVAVIGLAVLHFNPGLRDRYDHWFRRTFRTELRAAHRHLVLLLILALIAGPLLSIGSAYVGYTAATHDWVKTIQQYRDSHHYVDKATVPTRKIRLGPVGGGGAAHSGSINFAYWPDVDDDQGPWVLSCAAHVFSKIGSYLINRQSHLSFTASGPRRAYFLSPRVAFDYRTHGANIETAVYTYPRILATHGLPRNSVFSYGPHQHPRSYAPYATEPVPDFARRAKAVRAAVWSQTLWYYPGAGPSAITLLKRAIGRRHDPVAIVQDWFQDQTRQSWVSGKMDLPHPGDSFTYAHYTVAVRFNDAIRFPSGARGGVLMANSFGWLYGVDSRGQIRRGHGGYVWMSYQLIERYAAYAEEYHYGPKPAGGGSFHQPPPIRFHAPYDPGPVAGGGGNWVHGVHLYNDARYTDISGLINENARRFGVSAVGITATLMVESGLRPIADHYPIAGAGYCDYSFGIAQLTVCTIAMFGVGNGTLTAANIAYVRSVEDYYPSGIYYGSSLLGSYAKTSCTYFPFTYVAYNAGPGLGCGNSFYFAPYGMAGSNFYNGFMPSWNYANANFATATYSGTTPTIPAKPKPKPLPFPLAAWCHYTRAHHQTCPNPYWHHHIGLAPQYWAYTAGVRRALGATTGHEQWNARARFMTTPFRHGKELTWPTKKHSGVKVVLFKKGA